MAITFSSFFSWNKSPHLHHSLLSNLQTDCFQEVILTVSLSCLKSSTGTPVTEIKSEWHRKLFVSWPLPISLVMSHTLHSNSLLSWHCILHWQALMFPRLPLSTEGLCLTVYLCLVPPSIPMYLVLNFDTSIRQLCIPHFLGSMALLCTPKCVQHYLLMCLCLLMCLFPN